MLKIYFRAGFRNLLRYRSASLINLIGLSLGFSAIMVLSVMLYQYLTVNGQFRNKDRMYYVKMRSAEGNEYARTPYPFLYTALQSCPDIQAGTHLQSWNSPWLKAGTKEFQENTWYADSAFLKVFSFPLEYGDPNTALSAKNNIVISHELAQKLFGSSADAIDKTLQLDDSIPMTVTGVLQTIPSNTTIRPEVLLTTALLNDNKDFSNNANWYNTFAENYFLLRPGADTARLNAQFNQLVATHFDPQIRKSTLSLIPYTHYIEDQSGNLIQVLIKGQIGTIVFILLLVVANLINLNAATLLSRQKEMAIRKMMGSGRLHLILQFVLENTMTVFAALLLAYFLFQSLLMPAINNIIRDHFGAIAVNIRHDYPLVGFFLGIGLLIIVLAGSFPSFHFGSLRAVDAIKGRITRNKDRHYTRNVFITLQFVLATTFIGVSIILHSQISHMKSATLGFDKDNLLVMPLDLAFKDQKAASASFDVLLNDLHHNPAVEGVSTSWNIPTAYDENFNTYYDPATNREVHMRQAVTDDGLLPAYHIPLAEGRNFNGVNDSLDKNKVIINRKAAQLLGWQQAVGRQLRAKGGSEVYTVIGVMEDFHYGDLTHDIDPLIHAFGGSQSLDTRFFSVRVRPGHSAAVLQQLTRAFAGMPSRRPFKYEYLSDRIDQQYSLLEGILKATNYIAVLTIFIAAMGLFGLIAGYARQRIKEVGIRKVLGANTADIIRLLSRNFLLLIGAALLIATPMVWMLMHGWLQDFAYRITIQWWMLLGAGGIVLGITILTIGFHAVRAAMANPVDSLRTE
jgi:putative ABC transport system permease protein